MSSFRDAAIRDGARRLWLFEKGSLVDLAGGSTVTLDAAGTLNGRAVRGRRNARTAVKASGAGRVGSAAKMTGLSLSAFSFEALIAPVKYTSGLRGLLSTATDSFNNTGAHLSLAHAASGAQPYWLVVQSSSTKQAITGRYLDDSEYQRLHHVVGTFSSAAALTAVYQQGVLTASAAYSSAPTDHPATAIGRHGDQTVYFHGQIFAIAVYDLALSAAQVRAHWRAAQRDSALFAGAIEAPLRSRMPAGGRR